MIFTTLDLQKKQKKIYLSKISVVPKQKELLVNKINLVYQLKKAGRNPNQ